MSTASKIIGAAMAVCVSMSSAFAAVLVEDCLAAPEKLNLNPKDWTLADGELKSVDGMARVDSFAFGSPDWADYEVEFKLRRLQVSTGDQHFGITLRDGSPGSVQLYSRGDSIFYKDDSRHSLLGPLRSPLPVGPEAPWTAFRIVIAGTTLKAFVDGAPVGDLDGLNAASGRISFYAYHLDIALKDLKVVVGRVAPAVAQANATSKNILHNSSFEQCTLDDLPDYWGCPHWGLADSYWATHFEEWQRNFVTDTTVAYDGKRSMRISNLSDKPSGGLTLWSVCVRANLNEPYTLSAYMRSEPAGVKVKMGKETFTLTTEWRRYSTAFVKTTNSLYEDMVPIAPQGKGVVWIDAAQLEKGALSAYQPMKNERPQLETEEGNVNKVLTVVPKHQPPRFDRELVLSGKLDDAVWARAPKLDFVTSSGDATKAPTEARVWYNDKGIYIGVKCFDQDAGKNKCAVTARDSNVWNDPSLEFFIDPQLSRNYYYHLAINQIGTKYDGFCGDMSWNGDWQAVTYTDPDGKYWSAELFIPFGELGIDPTSGDWWGFNICRENHALKEYSCWSPTYGGFHTPTRFGQIGVDRAVQENYYAGCRGAQLQSVTADRASLAVTLYNNTKRDQVYNLSARLMDQKRQEIARFSKTVELKRGAERTVELGNVACPAGAKYRLMLELRDDDALRFSGALDLETPESLSVMTQYDLYTREEKMLARVQVNLGDELLSGATLRLRVQDASGKEVLFKAVDKPGRMNEVELGVGSLADGDYVLRAELSGFTASKAFRKLPPVANEVKADHFSRMTVVDGKPFFPFGIALEGNATEECLKYYGDNGISSVVVGAQVKDYPGATRFLDCAAANNVKVWYHLHSPRDDAARKAAADFVAAFKSHPALLGWSPYDEVFTIEWGKDNYPAVMEEVGKCKRLDPYHPGFVNENSYGLSFLKNNKLDFPGDVVSIDYYAYPPARGLQLVSNYAKTMGEMGAKEGKPSWMYLFGAGYTFWASRDLTPAEQEFETYAAIINGVRGLYYWADHPKSKSHWERLKRLAREVKTLTPVLASVEPTPEVKCNNPAIELLVKKADGKVYLIAVNNTTEPLAARFDLSGLKGTAAEALFEGRNVELKQGVLGDTFAGYQRHVYVIAKERSFFDALLPW